MTARHVVLAVPHQALENIRLRTPLLAGSETDSLIGSVTGHPAAKLSLAYERPWWRETGIGGMRAVSDLWLSKTYYFDQRDGPAAVGPALLLASYSDGPSREAWCSGQCALRFPRGSGAVRLGAPVGTLRRDARPDRRGATPAS